MTRPLLIAAAVAAYCALLWLYADTHADRPEWDEYADALKEGL